MYTFFGLLIEAEGFSKILPEAEAGFMMLTAEAADLAIDTEMGEAIIGFFEAVDAAELRSAFGVIFEARGCNEVESWSSPVGIPGWPPVLRGCCGCRG